MLSTSKMTWPEAYKIDLPRQHLLTLFQTAIKRVNGHDSVVKALYGRQFDKPLYAIAIGKAASSMMQGAIKVCDAQITKALLITKYDHLDSSLEKDSRITCIQAAHPLPDKNSIKAGKILIEFLQAIPEKSQILFLISGGASSLVEVLPSGVSLEEFQLMTSELLANDFSINEINYVRKQLSEIKGGKLLNYCKNQHILNLMISDVPSDDIAVIGSGLLVSQQQHRDLTSLPEWIEKLLKTKVPQTVSNVDVTIAHKVIANNQQAIDAIIEEAKDLGYSAIQAPLMMHGNVNDMAKDIVIQLEKSPPGVIIWGGECTVNLPEVPGRGGRNQHLALLVAQHIQESDKITLLAIGTDGTDGPGDDAGALVDAKTIARGKAEGFLDDECIENADSGRFLQASGDLIHTGATGTNVMDLVIAIKGK